MCDVMYCDVVWRDVIRCVVFREGDVVWCDMVYFVMNWYGKVLIWWC